jgi:hypothetical protein
MDDEKAVLRFLDGRTVKGYVRNFCEKDETLCLQDPDTGEIQSFHNSELKAVFFVRSFEGKPDYNEKKTYGIRRPKGHRTFIKFIDGEDMVGFIEGDLPWKKGFFLSSQHSWNEMKGLFLLPADNESNNIRVFVLAHAIKDATVVP